MSTRGIGRAVIAGLLLSSRLPGQEPGESSFRLTLNIPAYRLEARDSGRVVFTARVAVGEAQYRTPTGIFAVSLITWNPWWYPPASAWAARDTVMPPCPQNPLGRVKLNFAPLYFIHGTPKPRSLGHAASHGCVRASQDDALALAALIVARVMPDSLARAASYAAGTATRTMRVRPPVPLEIRYEVAEVRGDSLWMYPDPYRRVRTIDQRVRLAQRALNMAHHDANCIPDAELRRLARNTTRVAGALLIPRAIPPSLMTGSRETNLQPGRSLHASSR